MIKSFLIIIIIPVVAFSQSGWYALNSGTSFNLSGVQFLDNNTGYYICSNNYIPLALTRKTTDGGISWVTVQTLSGSYIGLTSLFFIDAYTGTVSGGDYIYRTTTGGNTWVQQSFPPGSFPPAFGLQYINANTGFASGNYRTVLFTTNGGSTWVNRPCGSSKDFWMDIYFFDANTGVIAGQAFNGIMKTTNAGLTWVVALAGISSFYSLAFANNLTGFCAGYSSIVKTMNSGSNWFAVYSSTSPIRGITAIDTSNVFAVGYTGKILRTSNSGVNWLQQSSGTSKALQGISFINVNTGWVVGDTGTLLKTTTGGLTSLTPISNEIPSNYSLYQNYPNPFNPVTHLRFEIPELRFVSLKIFDIGGREVATLVNEQLQPGTYEVEFDGTDFSSGVYYYKLTAGDYTETKKMVLMK